MENGISDPWVSLKLADGEFYPLFHRDNPDTRSLTLVPAQPKQGVVHVAFFHHDPDESQPQQLGTVEIAELPEDAELVLDASLSTGGLLSVSIRHSETGRRELFEAVIAGGHSDSLSLNSFSGQRGRRWILGALFTVLSLVLIAGATWFVTLWGKEDPAPSPQSHVLNIEEVLLS